MTATELRLHTNCDWCDRPIGHAQNPIFHVVHVASHVVNLGAIANHDGLAAILGGSQHLASVMSGARDLTLQMGDPQTLTCCQTCYLEHVSPTAQCQARHNDPDTPSTPVVVGQHLFTKDGRVIGNAIVTEVTPEGLARIETDFGNGGSLLNAKEIAAWWHTTDAENLVRVSEVSAWRSDKNTAQTTAP